MKRRRERIQKQSSLLSKLTRQLSIHDSRAAAASGVLDTGSGAGDKCLDSFCYFFTLCLFYFLDRITDILYPKSKFGLITLDANS